MFYLTTHSTHFIYGYMASDIWLRTILIVRKETRCHHIGYSYRLTARVLLYAPSHRQDNTYHGLCYTSCGALAGTRNSSMGRGNESSIRGNLRGYFPPFYRQYSNITEWLEGRKEMFYLTTHSTRFIYGYMEGRKEMVYLTTHSTHFIYGYMEGRKEMFYLTTHSICFIYGYMERRKKMFYLTTHSTRFIYGYMEGTKNEGNGFI